MLDAPTRSTVSLFVEFKCPKFQKKPPHSTIHIHTMSYSLWLVPHADGPFNKTVQELISDTVPRNFVPEKDIQSFTPHVTVTSGVDVGDKEPQQWLDQIQLPDDFKPEINEVLLELDSVEVEDAFFRKMTIAVKPNANLSKLAVSCRSQSSSSEKEDSAQIWAKNEYHPHLSLLYADVPAADVKKKVPLIEMKLGFAFGDLFACCGGTLCFGGLLVLVDTSKSLSEWEIVAKRETPWAIWRATKNLI